MNLTDVFSHVAHKKLAAVELPGGKSTQHELHGTEALKEFFGARVKTKGDLHWRYFADDQEVAQDVGGYTFYDCRAKSSHRTGRTEWHFYYTGNFLAKAKAGDVCVLAKSKTGQIFALVFQARSAWLRASRALFDVDCSDELFQEMPKQVLDARKLELLQQQILEELDLGIVMPVSETDEEIVIRKFGRDFPKTKTMSAFARTQVRADFKKVDEALTLWLEREEQLFRALEKVIISERLDSGFSTVDDFISFSLSVQNRRKSRMGFALQNHLSELFTRHKLHFTPQARTEASNRPDFIFPGEAEYHNPNFSDSLLVMLGVKSTSKDRWRQVLTEADRIPNKHLCTLEAGISTRQTDEMRRQNLTLVVPASLHQSYSTTQQTAIMSLAEFIDAVRLKQAGS